MVKMITNSFLVEVRRRALRRGVWFRALDRVERGIRSLAARVVDRVKSVVLGVELVKTLKKFNDALKSGFVMRIEEYRFSQARELVAQVVEWDYGAAAGWASDLAFVRYLTLNDARAQVIPVS